MEQFKIVRESLANKFLQRRTFFYFILHGIIGFFVGYVFLVISKLSQFSVQDFFQSEWLKILREHLDVELGVSVAALTFDFYKIRKKFKKEIDRSFSENQHIISAKDHAIEIINHLNHLSEGLTHNHTDNQKIERIIENITPYINYSKMIIEKRVPITEFRTDWVNFMYSSEGLVSITTTEPLAWLDPFFYFYLINNGIVNFKWSNSPLCKSICPPSGTITKPDIHISDNRSDKYFTEYSQEKDRILTDMSTGGIPEKKTLRFMIIQRQHFTNLKYYLACFQAIHEIFGQYLILIEKEWFLERFPVIFDKLKNSLEYTKDGLDIGITILDKKFSDIYFINDDGFLTYKTCPVTETAELVKSISAIAGDPENKNHILIPEPLNRDHCLMKVC